MELLILHACEAQDNDGNAVRTLQPNDVVEYRGHLPGQAIVVEYKGQRLIINPAATNIDCQE